MTTTNIQRAAVMQALVLELGITKAFTARVMGVSTHTVWQSVNACPGSGRRPWAARTDAEKTAAVEYANKLLKGGK